MRKINTRLHGMLDYGSAFILLLPWITGFFTTAPDTSILALAGSFTCIISLFTNYELGLVKAIPMKVHLFLDVLTALFLIALPFIFPVTHYAYYWPSLLGAGELIIVLFSRSTPYTATLHETHMSR